MLTFSLTDVVNIDEFKEILSEATSISSKIEPLPHTEKTLLAVGDVHGDVHSVETALQLRDEHGLDAAVFIGDFVDRGDHQVETLVRLCRELIENPSQIFLVRGNHEDVLINQWYGFTDVLKALSWDLDELLPVIGRFYSSLPLGLVKEETALFVHGGIPYFNERKMRFPKIEKLPANLKPYIEPIVGLLWNDPLELMSNSVKIEPFFYSSWRGDSFYAFTEDATRLYLDNFGAKKLVRAHTALRDGYRRVNDSTISLFSSASGKYAGYSPAYLKVTDQFEVLRAP